MQVSSLQCPRCFAPIDPASAQVSTCRYCGTTLAIQGAAPIMAPLTAPPGALFIESAGSNFIGVIKVVRENTGLGLREAKELCDRIPCAVAQGMDPAKLDRFRRELINAGARVR